MTTAILIGVGLGISFGCLRTRCCNSETKAFEASVSEIEARIKA